MPNDAATPRQAPAPDLWQRLTALVAADGSAAQPVLHRLSDPRRPLRDAADALHCLCLLHGRDAGIIGTALARTAHPVAREWFTVAAQGFARERDWLSRLVAAAGPLPSTAGQTASESAIATQRHALDMLANSERTGVSTGAAAALVLDWYRLRPTLEAIADRLYVEIAAAALPSLKASQALLDTTPVPDAAQRGFLFGAQQLLAQQRGLWGLIEARASARDGV